MKPTTLFVSFDRHGDAIIQVHYTDGKWQEFSVTPTDGVVKIDLERKSQKTTAAEKYKDCMYAIADMMPASRTKIEKELVPLYGEKVVMDCIYVCANYDELIK